MGTGERDGGALRLRLPPRAYRPLRASFLYGSRAGRRADYPAGGRDLLQPLLLRGPPRVRARALRAGPAARPAVDAAGQRSVGGLPRVAVTSVGKHRGTKPGLLARLLPACAGRVPGAVGERRDGGVLPRGQPI